MAVGRELLKIAIYLLYSMLDLTRYPTTVAIANNREEIGSLLRQLEQAQSALDQYARVGTAPTAQGKYSLGEWERSNSVNSGHWLGGAQSASACSELCRKADAQFCAYQCNGCYSGTSLAPRSEASFQSCFQYAVDMRTGTDAAAFREQQQKRDSLITRIEAKVRQTSALLGEQIQKGETNQGTIGALQGSLSQIEQQVASYRDKADIVRSEMSRVQGELETTKYRMNSELLQLLMMLGGVVLIIMLSAGSLGTAGTPPQEIVIIVAAGVLTLYFAAQYVLDWWKK